MVLQLEHVRLVHEATCCKGELERLAGDPSLELYGNSLQARRLTGRMRPASSQNSSR